VRALTPFFKPISKWWDGYNDQEVVLIDDFELTSLKYLDHYLKLWADPWGALTGEIKGGTINLNYKKIYITSNYSISQCVQATHNGDEQLELALLRRF